MTRTITVPTPSLVVLIGTSGAGKSTFAAKHFARTEVLSSDFFRGLVSDDENAQGATNDAFEALHFVLRKRLALGRLTVVDATNVQAEARRPLVAIAREFHLLPVAIVLGVDEDVCIARNALRPDRAFGPRVVRGQARELRRALRTLGKEGFRHVFELDTSTEVDEAVVVRQKLYSDRREERGPFDVIGDVHGCADELVALLDRLGYARSEDSGRVQFRHPEGRRVVFLGDLVDRGPDVPGVLRVAMSMVRDGTALCVPGNHDVKLVKHLRGRDVRLTHGLEISATQLAAESAEFRDEVVSFLDGLVSHYVLDDGRLVVAHAGLKQSMHGRSSGAVREFCLYGETTGETDAQGFPVRADWAAEYRGDAHVVYGHTPTGAPEWFNRTLCIDTGCVFGGALTALRYPERELVSVKAARVYYEPRVVEPPPDTLRPPPRAARDDLLDAADVLGKRLVETRSGVRVVVREENAAAALEVMSRFAVDPRWLVYLPPTMSPSETSAHGPYLEHPREALAYFERQGLTRVIAEQKHMGSRAVVVVCRDATVAARRFGVDDGTLGVVVTRTGRPFFGAPRDAALLDRLRAQLERTGLWDALETDWLVLDCELMPWSAKAQELLRRQYAAVGAAASSSLDAAVGALTRAAERDPSASELLARFEDRRAHAARYVDAYARYCWPVEGLDGVKLAPFHVLAGEGRVFDDRDHVWHVETARTLVTDDEPLFVETPFRVVELTDEASRDALVAWWEALTEAGGEGMVLKPLDWDARGPKGAIQPAIKCRGREYLRIIYGPEYARPEHLERLRKRSLGSKRGLALREYALGLEGLHRFVERESLRRVHECVFALLASESEPVDPRL